MIESTHESGSFLTKILHISKKTAEEYIKVLPLSLLYALNNFNVYKYIAKYT